MLKFIVLIVMIQLFYGFGITMFAYSLPAGQLTLIGTYEEPSTNLDMTDISQTIEENIQSQLGIPFVDIGALVFFSGNIVIDMLINFFTAIPSMITIAISTFFSLFPIDAFIAAQIKLLLWVVAAILYFIAFLAFIMSVRSQTGSVV
jgi:hypothetical protein